MRNLIGDTAMSSPIKQLVIDYFSFVDNEDLTSILQLMSPECVFYVETHCVKLSSRAEISAMFRRLWDNHQWVKHDQFNWIEGSEGDDIAVRFSVTNKLNNGKIVNKSNCNFFTMEQGLLSEIRVYMAGENTLNSHD